MRCRVPDRCSPLMPRVGVERPPSRQADPLARRRTPVELSARHTNRSGRSRGPVVRDQGRSRSTCSVSSSRRPSSSPAGTMSRGTNTAMRGCSSPVGEVWQEPADSRLVRPEERAHILGLPQLERSEELLCARHPAQLPSGHPRTFVEAVRRRSARQVRQPRPREPQSPPPDGASGSPPSRRPTGAPSVTSPATHAPALHTLLSPAGPIPLIAPSCRVDYPDVRRRGRRAPAPGRGSGRGTG